MWSSRVRAGLRLGAPGGGTSKPAGHGGRGEGCPGHGGLSWPVLQGAPLGSAAQGGGCTLVIRPGEGQAGALRGRGAPAAPRPVGGTPPRPHLPARPAGPPQRPPGPPSPPGAPSCSQTPLPRAAVSRVRAELLSCDSSLWDPLAVGSPASVLPLPLQAADCGGGGGRLCAGDAGPGLYPVEAQPEILPHRQCLAWPRPPFSASCVRSGAGTCCPEPSLVGELEQGPHPHGGPVRPMQRGMGVAPSPRGV